MKYKVNQRLYSIDLCEYFIIRHIDYYDNNLEYEFTLERYEDDSEFPWQKTRLYFSENEIRDKFYTDKEIRKTKINKLNEGSM